MSLEIWRALDGLNYSNFEIYGYEISSLGRIRSVDRYITTKNGRNRFHKGCERKTKLNNRGYEMVSIYTDGKEKTCLVHRLVAMVFIENINNLPEVNHKDNDKSNNNADNLEWMTSKDNHTHAIINGFRFQNGQDSVNSKLSNKEVEAIRDMWINGKFSQQELANSFNVGQTTIGRIVRRESYKNT